MYSSAELFCLGTAPSLPGRGKGGGSNLVAFSADVREAGGGGWRRSFSGRKARAQPGCALPDRQRPSYPVTADGCVQAVGPEAPVGRRECGALMHPLARIIEFIQPLRALSDFQWRALRFANHTARGKPTPQTPEPWTDTIGTAPVSVRNGGTHPGAPLRPGLGRSGTRPIDPLLWVHAISVSASARMPHHGRRIG